VVCFPHRAAVTCPLALMVVALQADSVTDGAMGVAKAKAVTRVDVGRILESSPLSRACRRLGRIANASTRRTRNELWLLLPALQLTPGRSTDAPGQIRQALMTGIIL
jgi:hypothetical protein